MVARMQVMTLRCRSWVSELKLARFGGNRYRNGSDDVKAIWRTEQANLPRALKYSETRRDSVVDPTTVTLERLLDTDDNSALHA